MGVRAIAGTAEVWRTQAANEPREAGSRIFRLKAEATRPYPGPRSPIPDPEAYFLASGISVTIVCRSIGKYFLIASWMFC